jgi:hypothetical protein
MRGKRCLTVLLSGCMLLLQIALVSYEVSWAGEASYPVPSYSGEELAKVKAWEKTWVGKRIDASNIDSVAEFIPENYLPLWKDTGKWQESWFTIVPYRQVMASPGDEKATRQYMGTASVDDNGDLQNYVNGIPFPIPKTAQEVMYNFDNPNFGDNAVALQDLTLIDGRRKYDRKLVLKSWFLYHAARREVPPIPDLAKNPKGVFRGTHTEYFEPASFKGTRSLSLKWLDRSRDFGSWSFSGGSRRTSRRSSAQRQSPTGGSDACLDDNLTYTWAVNAQTYKMLGKKEILAGRHQDQKMLERVEGQCLYSGQQRERINCFVLEAINKDPNYLYSKQIYYIDPETWWILYADKYDKKGRMWKIFDNLVYLLTSEYNGSKVTFPAANIIVDVQRTHSTLALSDIHIGQQGEFWRPEFYQPRALQKYGY